MVRAVAPLHLLLCISAASSYVEPADDAKIAGGIGSLRSRASAAKQAGEELPNILLVLADDQSTLLDSLSHMPKLKSFVADEGVTVDPMFVTTPVCCPSRSALYTGKYIHNIGVHNNSAGSGGCSSLQWQAGPERHSIAYFMSELGYATSFAGKYMNNYGYGTNNSVDSLPQCLNATMAWDTNTMRTTCAQRIQHVPRGWSNWQALRGNSVYYNYTLSNNGVAEVHGDDYHEDYLVDLVKNRTVDFVADAQRRGQPFFAVCAVPACHEPADPAPQYASYGEAEKLVAPRTPNFNMVMGTNGPGGAKGLGDDDGRHWMVANVNGAPGGEAMNDTVVSFVDLLYRRRLATLQSVDDLIEAVLGTIDAAALDNTYVVYTADNGYHLGQFAIALDKRQPYETDVKVPFFARGPGIPRNSLVTRGALISIDLAPTFLQWAGVGEDAIDALGMDGAPMAALIASGDNNNNNNDVEEVEAAVAAKRATAALTSRTTSTTAPTSRDFLIEYQGEKWDACAAYLANDFPGVAWDKLSDGVNCGLRGPSSFKTEPVWEGEETWSSIQDTANNTYNCVRSVASDPSSLSSSSSSSSSSLSSSSASDSSQQQALAAAASSELGSGGGGGGGDGSDGSTDEIYCEWVSGEVEYYDLVADPWQLQNLAPTMDPQLQKAFQQKLAGLMGCAGRRACASAAETTTQLL